MPKFSILCPTRERLQEFKRYIESIRNTTKHPENIEILVVCDDDHLPTIDNIQSLQKEYPQLNIRYFLRKRTIYLNKDYYNWLAQYARGDYLWISADDLRFLIEGWDEIILQIVNDYLIFKKDRIVCFGIKDNTPKPSQHLPKFPCFPMFTKECYKALGFLLHPEIPTWGADYLIYQLYNKIGRFERIENKVYLNHISPHTKAVEEDNISRRVGCIFNQLKNVPQHNIQNLERILIPKQVKILQEYIREHS